MLLLYMKCHDNVNAIPHDGPANGVQKGTLPDWKGLVVMLINHIEGTHAAR